MRYRFVRGVEKAYPVSVTCRLMRLSRSCYYQWRHREASGRARADQRVLLLVKRLHREAKETYGARRMAIALGKQGIPCGRRRARTLMRLAAVAACYRRKYRSTTESDHQLPVAPNLLGRKFDVAAPNRVWVGDITYIWTSEGWLYLAAVLDLHSRRVVGWSLSKRLKRQLVIDALTMAYFRRRPSPGLVFHSDRGSQYCSREYRKKLKGYKMIASMSRKGDCWDNSVMERFFGSLKRERTWRTSYETRAAARQDIVDYIEMFYNSKRAHSYLGYLSPMEFEEQSALKNVA